MLSYMSTESLKIPQWQKDMINVTFSTSKGTYKEYDRPFFCVQCKGQSLSVSEGHECRGQGHRVFQAMKCSGHYGYRKDEIDTVKKDEDKAEKDKIDVKGVCPFKVNNGCVYFPKSRLVSTPKNTDRPFCVTCGFVLPSEHYVFCSILCKLTCPVNVKLPDEALEDDSMPAQNRVVLPPKKRKVKEEGSRGGEGKKRKSKKVEDEQETKKKNRQADIQENGSMETLVSAALDDEKKLDTNCGISYRKRSRKGVPCRAPFF